MKCQTILINQFRDEESSLSCKASGCYEDVVSSLRYKV
jgi:hypothetical protein